jgi:hypothetical protein
MKTLAKEKKREKESSLTLIYPKPFQCHRPGHSGSGEWLNVSMTGLQKFQKKHASLIFSKNIEL